MPKDMSKQISLNVLQTLDDPKFIMKIERLLPGYLSPKRFLQIAITEFRKTPKLKECEPASFLGAIIQCAELGLEPGDALQRVHLIPYKKECQVVVGYKGLMELARISPQEIDIEAHCVYEKDKIEVYLGLHKDLIHEPYLGKDRGQIIAAYAVATFKNGRQKFEVMPVEDIKKIQSTSHSGAWTTNFSEMARKTPIRKLCKFLPAGSKALNKAVIIDEKADMGTQNLKAVYDGEFINEDTGEIKKSPPQPSQADNLAAKLANDGNKGDKGDKGNNTANVCDEAKDFFGE